MSDEPSLTSRQDDRLQTDIANVESGLEVIMEQVARRPAADAEGERPQGNSLGDRDPGEDEGASETPERLLRRRRPWLA